MMTIQEAFIQARNEANQMTFVNLNKRMAWIQRRARKISYASKMRMIELHEDSK